MSQRLGMADGRCFTIHSASQLTNSYLMQQNGIDKVDNYSFRQALQKQGPEFLSKLQEQSRAKCDPCDNYTDMSNTY